MNSAWVSNKKYRWASRENGRLTVIWHRGTFKLLSGRTHDLDATTLDDAVLEADQTYPPKGWTWDPVAEGWTAPGWTVAPGACGGVVGWLILAEDGSSRSQHVFSRADLARKWCEIRVDRVGINLRGPKPAPKKVKKIRKTRTQKAVA